MTMESCAGSRTSWSSCTGTLGARGTRRAGALCPLPSWRCSLIIPCIRMLGPRKLDGSTGVWVCMPSECACHFGHMRMPFHMRCNSILYQS
jgi:hypothetical protein